jgi:ferric-dicitrate binding protein FerR (iron transport regulator)
VAAKIPRSSGSRQLWGDGRGRFRTRGRYGAATVRGTKWLTDDRCDGTLVRVKRGKVDVQDLQRPRQRPTRVKAGQELFVKKRGA